MAYASLDVVSYVVFEQRVQRASSGFSSTPRCTFTARDSKSKDKDRSRIELLWLAEAIRDDDR